MNLVQIRFFNPSFVMETIAIINEYQKDISYLKI